ncbi:MAG: hypothetical protein D3907_03320, partial [Candidatus Electrothrix sp. AUS3]|nr:hypothetical protein [Candidatus Electrothrix gigas]
MEKLYEDKVNYKLENEKNKSIAQTIQMLAHDVRKPFALIKGGLESLKNVEDLNQIKEQLKEYNDAVNKSLSGVNGMISDVLEIGSGNSELIMDSLDPKSIIYEAIQET